MELSKKEVEHISKLARIELTETEIAKYASEFSEILDYINELRKLDISNVKEIGQITGLTNRLAKDEIGGCEISRDELLANAPAVENGQIKVKSVLGRET